MLFINVPMYQTVCRVGLTRWDKQAERFLKSCFPFFRFNFSRYCILSILIRSDEKTYRWQKRNKQPSYFIHFSFTMSFVVILFTGVSNRGLFTWFLLSKIWDPRANKAKEYFVALIWFALGLGPSTHLAGLRGCTNSVLDWLAWKSLVVLSGFC